MVVQEKLRYNSSTIVIKRDGNKACVVSRGYGGKNKYPHYVTKNDTFCKVGDEPIIISKKGAVIVSKVKKRWNNESL